VPHGFDQPDNAARLQRLGVAEILPAGRYRADRAAVLLERLLREPSYLERGVACAAAMRDEDGALVAAGIVAAMLDRS
jgi:rhamnosyltransferase subunit B